MSSPTHCDRCGGRTDDYPDVTQRCICVRHQPRVAWMLTDEDKAFLRRTNIDPEDA